MTITYQTISLQSLLESEQTASALAIFFTDDGVLFSIQTQAHQLPFKETTAKLACHIHAAHQSSSAIIIKCKLDLTHEKLLADGLCVFPIKSFLAQLPAESHFPLIQAYHWLQWDLQSRFCGQCGNALESVFNSAEKKCLSCGRLFFPRFSPAIMVLIRKDNQILLARSPHFPPGIYSALAGFIDMGETAEMAVHREVEEEVGIKVTNLHYFGSQTWPFPDSFMIAFTATYLSGEININTQEIETAQWFSLDALPPLPNKASIARRLIESVINQQK